MYEGKNFFKKNTCFLIILIIASLSCNCFASTKILNVRYWTAPDHTRIVLDVDNEPFYVVTENENRIVLNFKNTSRDKSIPDEIILNKPGIKKLFFYNINDSAVKVELCLDEYQKAEVFKLKKFQDRPDRVVVDIMLMTPALEEELVKETLPAVKRQKIIVIDPGHGGDDPGAISRKRVYEKDIVLSISREIKKEINKIPGYQAVLTRKGDYYVSFSKRLQIAKDLEASLFISVHADAARNRKAKGSSVYCLSTGGASNAAAKLLANNENLSDIIGGVPGIEGKNEFDPIILNMFQTSTINLSKTYADTLINHLNRINCLKYKSVQEAPFNVLKLPDIPAVLLETAYISNPQEESLLRNSNFQKRLAAAVASSVSEYFIGTASVYENIKATEKQREKSKGKETATIQYKIKRGDTLSSVARRFDTTVAILLKLNNLKLRDKIYVGRKILVPLNTTGKNARRIYTVKKGDTLFSLAKKNTTTIQELLELNNMKRDDTLYLGKRIRLP
ncbi:MAG: hypothetical protein A2031_00410 [Deltaproteobacteria bacterium RBG_19FT_COMBO_43_11]|nr:MAG: hypothetical protein A2031_00410 [Deltaproteobacteria bacterium RBG_19FT_COMBO_43_11]